MLIESLAQKTRLAMMTVFAVIGGLHRHLCLYGLVLHFFGK